MTLINQLSNYARCHRDRRNIATHFVGIPMIVVATATLLSRPSVGVGPLALSPAVLVALGSVVFYWMLDRRLALVMAALFAGAVAGGAVVATMSTTTWLAVGVGSFALGWLIQFIGHFFEGAKPAFVDDLRGLLVGPLFLVAEVAFAVGWRTDVRDAVEAEVGPTRGGPHPEPVST